jgi:hypothetical protein
MATPINRKPLNTILKIIDIIPSLTKRNDNCRLKICLIPPLQQEGKIRDIADHPTKDPAPDTSGARRLFGPFP